LSRTKNRLILNEVALVAALTAAAAPRPVKILRMEEHSLTQQMEILGHTDLVVGMHGSMLAMAMFLPPGAAVLELYPYAVPPQQYTPFRTLCALPGMNLSYTAWSNPDPHRSRGHPEYPAHLGGLDHLCPEEREAVINAPTVPPHLCCSDPSWLYHIYQDTDVDLEAVVLLATDLLAGRYLAPVPPPDDLLPTKVAAFLFSFCAAFFLPYFF
jgi:protein O-mannose beta-1,4-N-acetylglucosaminyltransferase